MDNLINKLEKLNFTKTESKVYLSLLKHGDMSGYQIGKVLGLSRSSVYSALDTLYAKGAITLLPGDAKIYSPRNPNDLIENIKDDFNNSANQLMDDLKNIQLKEINEGYMNIKGKKNIVSKMSEMIKKSTKEIYMNTDFDVELFKNDLAEAINRGVRVVIFSFSALNFERIPLEFYSHGIRVCECGANTRLMLVIDYEEVLIASKGIDEDYIGTFSFNKLLVQITSEHIHHDIYLMKLKEKYGEDLFDESIVLNTLMEKENSFDDTHQ
ncbi:TrmB family transcriptional regulator [Oceanirhabdus seepicola]|uniref:TrmB family transcriptional regulator n=1 Tax=Oceanirhabdus seepicola TaxID=2828781 RepID=A0A9J6P1V1_9CLOT|nr:helix-turn-helix domain-containing protein [Oceanirhabdus seepicola]MCM1990754.1 TrmB family transcriptional regulator [Oceanirhabdus seepicola]